jgi:hypothetical protein
LSYGDWVHVCSDREQRSQKAEVHCEFQEVTKERCSPRRNKYSLYFLKLAQIDWILSWKKNKQNVIGPSWKISGVIF